MKQRGGKNFNYSNRNRNPRRGPPGMLVFCETGREKKCISEGMDILNHYYNNQIAIDSKDDNDAGDNADDNADNDDGVDSKLKEKKTMTLEEEIQMMKQEKKKSPFQVYETGCRGSVFFMCSSKNCNTIVQHPQNPSGADSNKEKEAQEQEQQERKQEKEVTDIIESNSSKRKLEDATKCNQKRQKTASLLENDAKENQQNATIWDPIETIQSIVRDIRKNDSSAPRSRFITKMIPIQATCYANREEIESTALSLLKNYLLPHGIKVATDNGKNETQTVSNEDNGDDGATSSNEKSALPTFKIEFRKRFCTHLKRDEVIKIVADTVDTLTNEYWSNIEYKPSEEKTDGKQNKSPPLFGIDLGNPDYTIIIEICKTLCTMCVMKDAQSYHHFNLIKMQEEQVLD